MHGTWIVTEDGRTALSLAMVPRVQVIDTALVSMCSSNFAGGEHKIATAPNAAVAATAMRGVLDQLATATKSAPH